MTTGQIRLAARKCAKRAEWQYRAIHADWRRAVAAGDMARANSLRHSRDDAENEWMQALRIEGKALASGKSVADVLAKLEEAVQDTEEILAAYKRKNDAIAAVANLAAVLVALIGFL